MRSKDAHKQLARTSLMPAKTLLKTKLPLAYIYKFFFFLFFFIIIFFIEKNICRWHICCIFSYLKIKEKISVDFF